MSDIKFPTSDFLNYAYTHSLGKEEDTRLRELYNNATSLLKTAHAEISHVKFIRDSYTNLRKLFYVERKSEIEFIKKYLKVEINYNDKNATTDLTNSINKILNDRKVYEDIVNKIDKLSYLEDAKEGGGRYSGSESIIYTYFNYT